MSTSCVLSVDQGTQSTRAYIFDSINLKILGYNNVSIPQIYPQPGWVEQEPEVLWDSVVAAIEQAIKGASQTSNSLSIKALGIANQRETIVVWDKSTGKPLYNAIIWNDSRTVEICSSIQESFGPNCFQDSTGLPISPYFSAYKLQWLRMNVKAVQEALRLGNCLFGTVDSWLCYKMTNGRHCIEISNASRTSLMNLETGRWDPNIINSLGLEDFVFPQIVSSAEEIGTVVSIPQVHGVKITGCLGDQQASLLGHRCSAGKIKNTYGTGSFLLLNTGEIVVRSKHGLLSTVAFKLGKDANICYALEGSISCAGQGVTWMRDSLGILDSNDESELLAASVPNCDGVIFVPAFTGLLAPWWAPNARGCILGISLSTTKAHIVRALLASICFQTKDVLEAVKSDSGLDEFECLFVDGGAAKNNLLLQMQANALGIPVSRPNNTDTTALGAAFAAGIGAKLWTSESVFEGNHLELSSTFLPEKCTEEIDYYAWKNAVKTVISHSDRIFQEKKR
eukprot:jgi/Picsp_1/6532/NSC_03875-R1_glycerol kinase